MEPSASRDRRYLFFKNDLNFRFLGEIRGASSHSLDAVASMDRNTELYFVSTRAHDATLGTLFRFDFAKGPLTGVVPVAGITGGRRQHIDVDAEISADGADGT